MASAGHLAPVGTEVAQDCVSMLGDAINLLGQSVEAMERLVRKEQSGGQAAGSSSLNGFKPEAVHRHVIGGKPGGRSMRNVERLIHEVLLA
ncbi:hypothetical protein BAE44_0004657 [Dichanthelium oligosanthes]|uniref:Uncharacterized protein n=1 Tax=Dichanthelium oligosanthes TaxID=888268 RepID=A0A1E5WA74_9POAL|nr:hypothetical protein BAE44_0004657 [Dichanthelium oligosanthes]